MELINKIRKSRKGFTLVEIIVVLVILAILAAFTIPAMIGFVNDARSKAEIAEARMVYVAAQSVATEEVGIITGTPTPAQLTGIQNKIIDSDAGRMAVMLNGEAPGVVSAVTVAANGRVTGLTYTGDDAIYVFTNGNITVTPN